MGTRLTKRTTSGVAYVGKRAKHPGVDECNMAGNMLVAAQREVMEQLAAYEDTGLSPAEIMELLQGNLRKN